MADLRVKLILDLINRLSGPARAARGDLKGVGSEARALGKEKIGDRMARDLDRTRASAARTAQEMRRLKSALRDTARQAATIPPILPAGAGAGSKGAAAGAMLAAGRSAMLPLGIGVGGFAAGAGAVRATRKELDFDKLMFELQKATDEQGAELRARETAIRRLALATGKSKEDLARVMIDAGFASRPKEDLSRFTEFTAAAMNAWNTTAEETGQGLAELGNIYRANQARIEEIGDGINVLADKSASKEADLLQFIRTAGAQALGMGIGAEQTAAFGAAMKERGIRTDVASTGFKALLTKLATYDLDDETFTGGLKAAGVEAKTFKKEIGTDAVGAIVKLLRGLDKIKDPVKRMKAFKDIGGLEYADDFSSLAGAVDRLQELLGLVGNKANYVGSTMSQAATASTKDFNKVERSMRAIEEAGSRLGKAVIIPLGAVAEKFNAIAKAAFEASEASARMEERAVEIGKKLSANEVLSAEDRAQMAANPQLAATAIRRSTEEGAGKDWEETSRRMDAANSGIDALSERRQLLRRQLERQISTLEADIKLTPDGLGDRRKQMRLKALRSQLNDLPSSPLDRRIQPAQPDEAQAKAERSARLIAESVDKMVQLTQMAHTSSNPANRKAFAGDADAERRRLGRALAPDAIPAGKFGFGPGGSPAGQKPSGPGPGLLSFGTGGGKAIKDAFTIDLGPAGMTMAEQLASGFRAGQGQIEGAADASGQAVRGRLAGVDLTGAGQQIMQSFANGIRAGGEQAVREAQSVAARVKAAAASGAGAGGRGSLTGSLHDGVPT